MKENPKYRKLQSTANGKLVMADNVSKVNRGDGKVRNIPDKEMGSRESTELWGRGRIFLSVFTPIEKSEGQASHCKKCLLKGVHALFIYFLKMSILPSSLLENSRFFTVLRSLLKSQSIQ